MRWLIATLALTAAPALAQQSEVARITALVVTTTGTSDGADALEAQLTGLGAQILRADSPNNAELRSVLTRFADQAVVTEIAIAVLDTPLIALEGRRFVSTSGLVLRRAGDLMTRALPLSAFARATDLAERGGAVIVLAQEAEAPIQGTDVLFTAPASRAGLSPIAVLPSDEGLQVAATLARSVAVDEVALADILNQIARIPGADLSHVQDGVVIKAPASVEEPVAAALPSAAVAQPEPEPEASVAELLASEAAYSLAELQTLEQGLPRSLRRRIQDALSAGNHYSGFIDGIFGVQTRAAILSWQEAEGLVATGYLTPGQVDYLNR